jgi:predicted glycoside hydrolase/deacetylase ChbG (UPF0249 family)
MKYIINADDFGRTETVNQAIVEGFRQGYLDRTTIMVNMPYFAEAIRLSEEYGFKDKVGLHINLTSGEPLTDEIKQCPDFCTDGLFNGKIFRDKKTRLFISHKEKSAIKAEINAQIEKYLNAGFTLKHADSHGHVHTFPAILNIVLISLAEYEFNSIRISLNLSIKGSKRIYKSCLNKKINRFNKYHNMECRYFGACRETMKYLQIIDKELGLTEIMLHPNIFNGDMQIGQGLHYEDIESWRHRGEGNE